MGHIVNAKGLRLAIKNNWNDLLPLNIENIHIKNDSINELINTFFHKVSIRKTGTILNYIKY